MIKSFYKQRWGAKKPIREAGFTLLELLLVLMVLGVITAVVYPNLTNIVDSLRLRSDALQLAQEMRAARTEAIMSQEARDIRFYPNNNGYYKMLPSNRVIYLSQGIRIQDNNFPEDNLFYVHRCRFYATGVPTGGHVCLTNRQGQEKYVIVSVYMGRIRVSDQAPDDE